MSRTLGAAIGAIVVILFFVFGITHSGVSPAASNMTVSVRP
jgi:hypothetical protein